MIHDVDKTIKILNYAEDLFTGDAKQAAIHICITLAALCEDVETAHELVDVVYRASKAVKEIPINKEC